MVSEHNDQKCLSSWESILILALSNIAIRNQDIVWNKKWEAIPSTQTKAWVVYGCLVNRNVFSLERGGHSTQDRGRLGILIPAMSWTQRRWLHTDHSLVREVAEILPLKERPVTPLMLEVFLGERSFSSNPGSGGFPKLDPNDRFSRYQLSERRSGKTAREEVPCMQVATTNMSVWSCLYLQIRYKPPFSSRSLM